MNFNSVLMNSKALFLFRIIRYLKSCDWNVDEAEKMLRNTLEYRRRNNIADIDCRWCHERPGYHTMVSTGIKRPGYHTMVSTRIKRPGYHTMVSTGKS